MNDAADVSSSCCADDHLLLSPAVASEYVQGLKLLESLDCFPPGSAGDSSVVQVVIGTGESRLNIFKYTVFDVKTQDCCVLSPL